MFKSSPSLWRPKSLRDVWQVVRFNMGRVGVKSAFSNVGWLSLSNIVKFIAPLVIIPIVSRSFSSSELSAYFLSQTFATWVSIIVEFGFNLSSTRSAALALNNEREVASLYKSTQYAKIFISLTLVPIALLLPSMIGVLAGRDLLVALSWLFGLLIALNPQFVFQAKEDLVTLAKAEIFGAGVVIAAVLGINAAMGILRAEYLILTFLLVRLGVVVALHREVVRLYQLRVSVTLRDVLSVLRASTQYSIFRVTSSFYLSLPSLFGGVVGSASQIAVLSLAERLNRIPAVVIGSFWDSFFARAVKDNNQRMGAGLPILLIYMIMGIVGSLTIFSIAKISILLFLGSDYIENTWIVYLMGVVPFLTALRDYFLMQILSSGGIRAQNVISALGFLTILVFWIMVLQFNLGVTGVILSTLIAHSAVVTSSFIFINRK